MINFIFDFDSTLVKEESLNEIINLSINNSKDKLVELENITKMGMEGVISFKESLEKRLKLGIIDKKMVNLIINKVKTNITEGMQNLVKELLNNKNVSIFIVSGGFTEIIIPTAKILGIPTKNIFANNFIYNDEEQVIGVQDSVLLQEAGKAKAIQYLKNKHLIKGKTIMIGDGYTDLETYLTGTVDNYVYFGGVVERESVRRQSLISSSNSEDLRKICLEFIS